MKIITISAKAQYGKDYIANIIKEQLEKQGHQVLITHFADLLKFICKNFFEWDGEKDKFGRTILQYVGTDVIRTQNPDYWVDFIVGILKMFADKWDYVIIPDARFPNENDRLKVEGFDVATVRIECPGFDNGLTQEQKQHPSETMLDNYNFDYVIINNRDETIHNEVNKLIQLLEE